MRNDRYGHGEWRKGIHDAKLILQSELGTGFFCQRLRLELEHGSVEHDIHASYWSGFVAYLRKAQHKAGRDSCSI